MKAIKKILLGIVVLIALLLVVAIFLPKYYAVEKEVVINKSKNLVFDYVKSLKNQKNFSTWEHRDPNMKNEYRGIDGTVGSFHGWDGNPDNVGQGSQEIKAIVEGERIDIELKFIKPFESTSPVYFITESINESTTKVKWGMKGHMNYPSNLMMPLLNIEKMIGDEYQKSLDSLKKILEN
jgi:hypothetical protein